MGSRLIKQHYRILLFLFFFCCVSTTGFPHGINYEMEAAPTDQVLGFYLKLGFLHILPWGLDHILFIICLCLLNSNLRTIIWQATAFTAAHSITLALSVQNIITLPAEVVEPIIAMSIFFLAVENLLITTLKPWRIIVVFMFGLMHGLGFASVLNEIGLPRNKFITAIVGFNLGVELGQLVIIALMFSLLLYPLGKKPWHRKFIVYPLSILIAIIAAYWTMDRIIELT